MRDVWESVLPFFAPVPSSLLLHLLDIYRHPVTTMPVEDGAVRRRRKKRPGDLERVTGFSPKEWQRLARDFLPVRREVFHQLDPLVKDNLLTTSWLLAALTTPTGHSTRVRVPRSTLSNWQQRGFIDVEQKHADPHKSAALRIVREIVNRVDPERERLWLPKGSIDLSVEEAMFQRHKQEWLTELEQQSVSLDRDHVGSHCAELQGAVEAIRNLSFQQSGLWRVCWRWDAPGIRGSSHSDPRSCFLPPPLPLAAETVLATGWMGERWEIAPDKEEGGLKWTRVNSKGLVSFYGRSVSFDGLVRWIPSSEVFAVPMETTPDLVLKLADITLNKLGHDLLSRAFPLQE